MVPTVGLLREFVSDDLIADKGYDVNSILDLAAERGKIVVIPLRSNRKDQREYDTNIYKERYLVENIFQNFKIYRRISTRY